MSRLKAAVDNTSLDVLRKAVNELCAEDKVIAQMFSEKLGLEADSLEANTAAGPSPEETNIVAGLTPEEKIALITSNLQEVLHQDFIEDTILKEKQPLEIYWGTAPTGRPHCGYFVPMVKIAHFLKAGCAVIVLLADIHAFLDAGKSTFEEVEHRSKYYEHVIKSILTAIGVPINKLKFKLGRDHQLSANYILDLYKLLTQITIRDARRAGADVVKQAEDPENVKLSSLVYPIMQSLDEQYLKVRAQFGGVDQRKIFIMAQDALPKIGYQERAHLMNPMVPGLAGGKMSASDPNSKIDILDTPDMIKKKVSKALCVPKEVEGNGVIAFVEHVLLPIADLKGKAEFVVERKGKGAGESSQEEAALAPLVYSDIAKLKDDYANDILTPQLLKAAVTRGLTDILAPVHAKFASDKEWQDVALLAYKPAEPAKKVKKVKDRGTGNPRAAANGELGKKTEKEEAELKKGTENMAVR
jgi:tyrosyl-tRNA synthetase